MINNPDDWNSHWNNFIKLTNENPADTYRYDLAIEMLEIKNNGKGCHLVDFGCGDGAFISHFLSRFPEAKVLGMDSSDVAVKRAQNSNPNTFFRAINLMESPFMGPTEYFNWGTHGICSEVIEHLDAPEIFLKNSVNFLKTGSALVVTVPGGPLSEFHRHIGHRRHFTNSLIHDLIAKTDFVLDRIQRSGFPFFNLYRVCTQLRGKKLLNDLGISGEKFQGSPKRSRLLDFAFFIFRPLFKLNFKNTKYGWQYVVRIVKVEN
jgi:SAM-dependent methyltransferase